MPFSLFRKLEDALRYAERVALYGVGEPLMNPDIVEMVAFTKRLMGDNGEIFLSTNGTLLSQKVAGKLVDAGLTSIYVSLDSLNKERLEGIRLGINYGSTLENFQLLLRRFGSDVNIGVEYVVMKENLEELPVFVAEAAEMGVNHVLVSHVVPYSEEVASQMAYTTASEESIEAGKELLGKGWQVIVEAARFFVSLSYTGLVLTSEEIGLLNSAWRKARKMGTELNVPLLLSGEIDLNLIGKVEKVFSNAEKTAREYNVKLTLPPTKFKVNERSCPYMEKKAVAVRWDGKVSPCQEYLHEHQLYINKHSKTFKNFFFGDIKEANLKEIWKGSEYVKFRERTENLPETVPWCGNCPYSTLKCWFIESNEVDCYSNSPSCSECIYSTGMAKCNI